MTTDKKSVSTENGFPKIAAPALRALENAGITWLEQLADYREAEVLAQHGMGPKAIEVLRRALAERGLGFRE